MVDLTSLFDADKTLKACDDALVAASLLEKPRPYLGASSIGENCSKKLWLRFRFVRESFNAETLKKFRDGHITEKTVIQHLKLLPFLKIDGDGENQIEISGVDGHMKGHLDGIIEGIIEAPKTPHVLEIKAVADKKFNEIKKYKLELGEKMALRRYSETYYAQVILYMHKMNLTRSFHIFATAGARMWMSVRTECDSNYAKSLIEKARRIIYSNDAPEGISKDPSFFNCRYCGFYKVCHEKKLPERQCRVCIHASPIKDGKWDCQLHKKELSYDEQLAGCVNHCFLPSFVAGEVVSATDKTVTYKMKAGNLWTDGV